MRPSGTLRRSAASAMSAFCIGEVPVPSSAILRTHNRPPLDEADFQKWRVPHPRDVIVVGVRNAMSFMLSAWFVRFSGAPGQLIRLPWGVAYNLSTLIVETKELHSSALYKLFPECFFCSPTDDFLALATQRFSRKAKLLGYVSEEQPPLPAPDMMHAAPEDSVCAICLEGGGELVKECCVPVCVDCHVDGLRTLCPVCDRDALNGSFACLCCMEAVPFAEHGNQCASCHDRTLCVRCWTEFGECGVCDPVGRKHM